MEIKTQLKKRNRNLSLSFKKGRNRWKEGRQDEKKSKKWQKENSGWEEREKMS
jgi:hypothetical protein